MPKRDKFDREYAVAVGHRCSEFPFDMLRYDACFPADESESSKFPTAQRSDAPKLRAVVVARYVGQPGTWTEARWDSFNWKLIRVARGSLYEAQEIAKRIEDGAAIPPHLMPR